MLCLTLFLVYNKFIIFFKYQGLYLLISYLNHKYFNYFILFLVFNFLYKYHNYFFIIIVYFFYYTINLYSLKIQLIPTSLLVGLNNIHPLLFYFSFIFYLFFIFRIFTFNLKLINIFYLSCVSLILGGYWGLGNSVWGFFWVNDNIEVILLSYICLLLVVIHNYSINLPLFVFMYFYLIINIYLLRINFTFTRHSFFNFNKIENIYIYTCFFFLTNPLFLILNFFFNFYLFNIKLFYINIFLVIFINLIVSYFYKFSFKNIIIHITFFSLYISWLKYRSNNITNFYNFTIFYKNFFLIFLKVKIVKSYYYLLKSKLLFFCLKIFYLYSFKYLIFFKKILPSYGFFFIILFFLISICKIYI